ncbi:unnamed protein product, partial [Porites evermanni]
TSFNECIICQNDRKEKLRTAKESSIKTLLAALERRRDETYRRLVTEKEYLQDKDNTIYWHSTCYSAYTSEQNLQYAEVQQVDAVEVSEVSEVSDRSLRSKSLPFDSSKCLICGNRSYKKCKEMNNASSFDSRDAIKKAAEAIDDKRILHILSGVNDDLVAAEAKYHKSCFSSYTSKSNIKHRAFKEEKDESLFSVAFKEMASTIQSFLDNGRAYDMSSLLTMYQHILKSKGIDADSYTKHKLKLRMQSHFGDDIVFHQQFDKKKPELVYSSKISLQDVINSAALELHTSNKQVISDEANARNCIFEAAKIIKHEIKECKGISTRPLDVSDLNEDTVRRLVPNDLYWLLRWIIGPTLDIEDTSTIDDKKVLSIAQDIIHCSSNARVKTPKHVSLAMSTHHLTGSKQIIILLNRMGHCISYDEMKSVDASLATEVLAQSEQYDTVLPSNISPGSFIQMGSDNDDFNEETIDGKNTTHVTTMVVYQRKPFGPEPKPTVKGDHSQRRRSLQQDLANVYEIQDFSVVGRRPTTSSLVGKINMEWYDGSTNEFHKASSMDKVWSLVRMNPRTGSNQPPTPDERQIVPSWSGFHSVLFPHVERATTIVIRMGGFHIAINFLSVIGKIYAESGLEDLLVESGVYAAGSTSALLAGKQYNRGVRAHKLVVEAFFRLSWKAFEKWLQNYARWIPVYLADMKELPRKHPEVHKEFTEGNHAISRSDNQPFAKVWTDMALEQSINADSKSKGGVVGITHNQSALQRWFLTAHERASVTTALKEMYAIRDSDRMGTHKESQPKRVQRDEEDVKKLIACFSSNLMTNPFECDADNQLLNIATGVVLPPESAQRLLESTEIGKKNMEAFIQDRLNTNKVSFWEPLKQLKIKTFASTKKKITLKSTNEKVISIDADRNLFGRLLIVANSREVNLRDVLAYELSPVPLSLAHCDGSLRKTTKSVLMSVLEEKVRVSARLPVEPQDTKSIHLIDGMAVVQTMKSGNASTFGELANKFYAIATEPLLQNGCDRVDIVFDQYRDMSIKSHERSRRGSSSALEVKINSPSTPVPKQWAKYISNPRNKTNLCTFLTQALSELGKKKLPQGKCLVIGGGCSDGESSLHIRRDHPTVTLSDLQANHEEADTRLLFHAKHASQPDSRIIIHSPDTDVLVLGISFYDELGCKELWLRTGSKDRLRYIPLHEISTKVGPKICKALPAFHALTGSDATSAFAGVGKKRAYNILEDSEVHQESLSQLGQITLTEDEIKQCVKFVFSLYPTTKKTPSSLDELRYLLFCQKRQKSEALPPTSDSFIQHLKRANYQVLVWRKSLVGNQDLPEPQCSGWKEEDGVLCPILMTSNPAPESIIELTTCNCKKSLCRSTCSCANNGLCCTEACFCMAEPGSCLNPHSNTYQDSDSEEEDDTP